MKNHLFHFILISISLVPLTASSQDLTNKDKAKDSYLGRINIDYSRSTYFHRTGSSFGMDITIYKTDNVKLGLRHERGKGFRSSYTEPFTFDACCPHPAFSFTTSTWGVNLMLGKEYREKLPIAIFAETMLGHRTLKVDEPRNLGKRENNSGLSIYGGLRIYISRIQFKAGFSLLDGIVAGMGINI